MHQTKHERPFNENLLGTRYLRMAANTVDYWMVPTDSTLTYKSVMNALQNAPVLEDASLQIYIHVPFCAQRCVFCAFTGANHLDFKMAGRYASLVTSQLQDMLSRTRIRGQKIRSVHIGGGSPDLLGKEIGPVLRVVRSLPGAHDDTEISVEMALSTVKKEFIEEIVKYNVTKASFGVQTLEPSLRGYMRLPGDLSRMKTVLDMIDGRIPVINADLITGIPGQMQQMAQRDLQALMEIPEINSISSYLLTPSASPSLISGLISKTLPEQATPQEQVIMRLNTYCTFLRNKWVRKGTNTYVDPSRVPERIFGNISGNECIGQSHYEAFLLGVGASAVSSAPGVRIEQVSDLHAWCSLVEKGEHPLNIKTCSVTHQKDTALWAFPLRHEGLPAARFERMLKNKAVSPMQIGTFNELISEGLILKKTNSYELSILGEIFMGNIVYDLKKAENKAVIDCSVEEGLMLGQAIAARKIKDSNMANNRQLARQYLAGAENKGLGI